MRLQIFLLSVSLFACERTIFLGETPDKLVFGDFDNDERDDIVAVFFGANPRIELRNSGVSEKERDSFTFPQAFSFPTLKTTTNPGDVDGDGDNDLVVILEEGFQVMLNLGDGTLITALLTPQDTTNLLRADLIDRDGDSLSELVVRELTEDGAQEVFFPIGADGVIDATSQPSGALECLRPSTCVDIDGDGDLDVLSSGSSFFRVSLNQGDDSTFIEQSAPQPDAFDLSEILLGDLDGDGDLDVVAVTHFFDEIGGIFSTDIDSFTVSFSLNNGDGAFGAFTEIQAVEFSSGNLGIIPNGTLLVRVADTDQDGAAEIFTANLVKSPKVLSFDVSRGVLSETSFRVGDTLDFTFASLRSFGVNDLVLIQEGELVITRP